MIGLGIFAKTFPGNDALTVLQAVRAAGYSCAQYNMACSGLPSMPDDVSDAAMRDIAAAVQATGVSLVALSATYNMIHPDVTVRKTGMQRLEKLLQVAQKLNIPLVTLCTGTRDAADQWKHHPDNATPQAWSDLLVEMEQAARLAETYSVDLGIEPEQANVVTNADDAMRLIKAINSPRIRIVLDPANLFEQASTEKARAIVSDAVHILKGHIAMAHAKDRHADGRFAMAGDGIVDFPDFLQQLKSIGFDGSLVTHGLDAADAARVARFLDGLR